MQFLVSLIVLASLATPNLALVSCPTLTTCKGLAATVASALKGYPAAETLCTRKFPVPRQTCTSTAPGVTVVSTVATSTVTTAIVTVTASSTAPTTTTTTTSIVTPTVTQTLTQTQSATVTATTTITVTANAKKRRSEVTARAVDPRASKLSSLASQASSFVGSVCTCLETPASITVSTTPTSINSVTATVTTYTTATTTLAITPTATVTATSTAPAITTTETTAITTTTTVTATATVTVPPARATCTDSGLIEGCPDGSQCNTPTSCTLYPEGVDACFNQPACDATTTVACSYDSSNQHCVVYSDCCGGVSRLRQRDTRVFKRNEIFVKVGSLGDRVFNVPVAELPA